MDGMTEEREFQFDAGTLVGDLRDAMLAELRDVADGKPWNERPEVQQRQVVERVHGAARGMVNKAVLLMSNQGFKSLMGELVQVRIKDGFQAQVNIPRGAEFRHELGDRQGKEVVLVLADADEFRGTRGAVPITPPAPLLDYAEEAARVADAAETPPEGWTPNNEGLPPEDAEEAPAADSIAGAAPVIDDGFVPDLAQTVIEAMPADLARYTPHMITDGAAIFYCWKEADGSVRCHEDSDQATIIASNRKVVVEAAEDDAWDTAEDRDRKKRAGGRRKANGAGGEPEAVS